MPKLSARANQMLIGVPILKHEPETDLTNFFDISIVQGMGGKTDLHP